MFGGSSLWGSVIKIKSRMLPLILGPVRLFSAFKIKSMLEHRTTLSHSTAVVALPDHGLQRPAGIEMKGENSTRASRAQSLAVQLTRRAPESRRVYYKPLSLRLVTLVFVPSLVFCVALLIRLVAWGGDATCDSNENNHAFCAVPAFPIFSFPTHESCACNTIFFDAFSNAASLTASCLVAYCNAHNDLKTAFCGGAACNKNNTAQVKSCRTHWIDYGKGESFRTANPGTCSGDIIGDQTSNCSSSTSVAAAQKKFAFLAENSHVTSAAFIRYRCNGSTAGVNTLLDTAKTLSILFLHQSRCRGCKEHNLATIGTAHRVSPLSSLIVLDLENIDIGKHFMLPSVRNLKQVLLNGVGSGVGRVLGQAYRQKAFQQTLLHLETRNNDLTSLPPELGALGSLTVMDIRNNKLTCLPSVGRLSSLEKLYAQNNHLTALPETFGQLAVLRGTRLGSNRITVLPRNIGQLSALEWLEVGVNRLTALPGSVGQLTKLTSLGLDQNRLTVLPETIGRLTALESLSLSSNRITILPETMGRRLTNLLSVDLHSNQLTR